MKGKATIVSVIAGGPSARGVNFKSLPGIKIGVNESGLADGVDIICSMDRIWVEMRWARMVELNRLAFIRRNAVQNIKDRPEWLDLFDCDHTSTTPAVDTMFERANGTNSGMCAVDLAMAMIESTPEPIRAAKQIVLVGFDMGGTGLGHWHEPYHWTKPQGGTSVGKFTQWARQFGSIAKRCQDLQIQVINASPSSAIPDFKRVPLGSILR